MWKGALRCEDEYQISNQGSVKSLSRRIARKDGTSWLTKERILKPFPSPHYLAVEICGEIRRERAYVHLLVLETFHGPKPESKEGSHLNGNELDNRAENLCWETHQENNLRKREHGTSGKGRIGLRGRKNPNAKLTEDDIRWIRKIYATGMYSQSKLAEIYEVGQDTISSIVNYDTWRHVA